MTGRTCLILQDGDPGPAAIHTGRRADPELSKAKTQTCDERPALGQPGHGMCPVDVAFPKSKAASTTWAGTSFPRQ